jgi:predicted metal-dependent enzyme (double-stranded beta helix superfamily)
LPINPFRTSNVIIVPARRIVAQQSKSKHWVKHSAHSQSPAATAVVLLNVDIQQQQLVFNSATPCTTSL